MQPVVHGGVANCSVVAKEKQVLKVSSLSIIDIVVLVFFFGCEECVLCISQFTVILHSIIIRNRYKNIVFWYSLELEVNSERLMNEQSISYWH